MPRLKDSLAIIAEVVAVAAVATGAVVLLADHELLAFCVVLAAGLIVARLAGRARVEAAAAAARADEAVARERETKLLAAAASSLLESPDPHNFTITPRLEAALAEAGIRLQLCHAPAPRAGEQALPVRMPGGLGWLYIARGGGWSRPDTDRLVRGVSDLIALAHERARSAETDAEAEADRRADLAKTAVMHAISHDLQTPLTAIGTAASALRESPLSEEDRTKLAAVIGTEAGRLERMVGDLLDLSRIEAGAAAPQQGWCDLHQVVGRAVDSVRTQHGDHPVTVDLPAALPPIRADAAQLERVFTNLLDNAVKFSPVGEPVEVRGMCANGRVTVRVLDHGRGIPPAQQKHVFQPFVRGQDLEPGSGLGLAVCRGFVEANGGRIALQSRGKGGSAFAVSFPVVAQPEFVS